MRYLRTVGLAHGHTPEQINAMPVADLEALAIYAMTPNMVRFMGVGD